MSDKPQKNTDADEALFVATLKRMHKKPPQPQKKKQREDEKRQRQ